MVTLPQDEVTGEPGSKTGQGTAGHKPTWPPAEKGESPGCRSAAAASDSLEHGFGHPVADALATDT